MSTRLYLSSRLSLFDSLSSNSTIVTFSPTNTEIKPSKTTKSAFERKMCLAAQSKRMYLFIIYSSSSVSTIVLQSYIIFNIRPNFSPE